MTKNTAQQNQPSADIPVEIIGYITDPKRVGYQILTNYESTYWRALVGNDAWGLYEVLRSFCHEGNNTCKPSISLLTDILGESDRRRITGRVRSVGDKEYNTPGLIDILQQYGLAVAEEKGKGAKLRYVFHVNLTPGVLSKEQIAQLSKRLQRKHEELLKRVSQEQEKLSEKVKRKKKRKGSKQTTTTAEKQERGMDNVQRGMDIVHTPSGQYPYRTTPIEQYPYTTTVAEKKKNNNNSSGEPESEQDVVVALIHLGISKTVAKRLASRYNRDRILEKIDFLEYLQKHHPEKVKNPKGWLRRAIEEDYSEPDGYRSPAEIAAAEAEEKRRREELARREAEEEARRKKERKREQEEHAAWLAQMKKQFGTTDKELGLWLQALRELELQMPRATYQAWFPRTQLLSLTNGEALIAVPNKVTQEWLEHRLTEKIKQTLVGLVDYPVEELKFVVLTPDEVNKPKQ